jgi:MurNAc alpha-1-phosphate uridylyltransferase
MMPLPTTAMVFAAGYGTRMREHAPDLPKPLVKVAGKALIDHVLDRLVVAGVTRAVVNLSYKGAIIRSHLATRTDVTCVFSEEPDPPLETGGGLLHALPLLGDAPVFVVNSDTVWEDTPPVLPPLLAGEGWGGGDSDQSTSYRYPPPLEAVPPTHPQAGGGTSALHRLAAAFSPETTDALLLLCPKERAIGYEGAGDFFLEADGRLRHRGDAAEAPYVFTGIQLLHPAAVQQHATALNLGERFSLSRLYRGADSPLHIRGLIHEGRWFHVGDGNGVAETERAMRCIPD